MKNAKIKVDEYILGFALAFGCLTNFRLGGIVGISEILFLLFLVRGGWKYGFNIVKFRKNFLGFSLYLIGFSFVLLAPILTAITEHFYGYNVTPVYIISYIMGFALLLVMLRHLDAGIDMRTVTAIYALGFLSVNMTLIAMGVGYENDRFSGFSKNPNQLYFYGSCLILMVSMYAGRYKAAILLVVSYILLESGSDSFKLALVVVPAVYLVLFIFFSFGLSYAATMVFLTLGSILGLFGILITYLDNLAGLWRSADEGGQRLAFLKNAIVVVFDSPFWGFGVGSYSGMQPYGTSEAHNTFLDFGMQFGLVVPVLIYIVYFRYILMSIRQREFLLAAIVVSFLISGLFHFNGRHFFFWIELAIFYYSLICVKKNIVDIRH